MEKDVKVDVPGGEVIVSPIGVVHIPLSRERYIVVYSSGRIEVYSDGGDGIGVAFDIPEGIEFDRAGVHVIIATMAS